MKYSALILLAIGLGACQYNNISVVPPKGEESTIVGKWNWTGTSGGLMPDVTPVTDGYNMTLILTADFKFVMYKNAAVTRSGYYSIERKANTDYIHFESDEGLMVSHPSPDVLALGDDAADGPKYHYIRIKY